MTSAAAGISFKWNTPQQVIAASVVLPALGLIAVSLRFRVRCIQKASIGLDDWTILFAMMLVVGLGICLLCGLAKRAIAYPTPPNTDRSPEAQLYQISVEQALQEKILWIFLTLLIPAYGLIKLSVIFFYRRIFTRGISRRFDIITKVSIVFVVLWTLAFLFLDIFDCGTSISNNFGPLIDFLRCANGITWTFVFYITDFVSDLVIICLPIPIVIKLHMRLAQKLAVVGILMLGAMSISAAITRIVFSWETIKSGFVTKKDVDENNTILLYWSMLEAGLSLIATCLPVLRPLCARPSLRSTTSIRTDIATQRTRLHTMHASRLYDRDRDPYTEINATPSRPPSSQVVHFDQHPETDKIVDRIDYIIRLEDLREVHVRSNHKLTV